MALSKLNQNNLITQLGFSINRMSNVADKTNPATVSSQQSEATFQFAHADYLTIQDALAQGETLFSGTDNALFTSDRSKQPTGRSIACYH